jgi:flagellar hook-associated protein 2
MEIHMGTVGISFGSPTAGTGFNVSQTVSEIVANLQNVESPWQTQLSASEAQDTVISSLGTLLSKLSTDIGNFTDFSGVLAAMDGSSSDPSVVALTSASSSAVPGTHSIVVKSLATTSSGYLDELPTANASDTLSGSISIQVGSGTAQTITLDSSDNTLSGLAAAINKAGIGVTASVLTDTTGSRLSLVSGTSGAAGDISVTASSIADTKTNTTLAYNIATPGADASLVVDGVTVSTASNTVSTVIPGVTFQLLAPSPTTTGSSGDAPEAVQVQIVNDTTSVTSSLETFVSDYNAVVSAINAQETNNTSGAAEPLFGTPTLSLLQEQLLGSINSTSSNGYLAPITNASDSLTGSISIAVGSASATPFTLSAGETLADLAASINADKLGVTASVVTNSTGSSLSLASNYGAAISVTSSITDATTGTSLAYTSVGDINSLSQLGISVNDDGTISLDTATLGTELNNDYSGVTAFFQDNNSWGVDFSNTLSSLGTSNVNGTLTLALNSNSSIESSLNLNISNENLLISSEQISLTLELTSANEILQSIPSNLNEVNELYSAITGYQAPQLG